MNSDRSRNTALVGGTLLIGFGLLSLASQLFRDIVNWSYLWPLAIVLVGGLFFAGMFLGGREVSGLAIPGTIIGGLGLLLLYQRLTGHWESWAYSWTLIVVLVGLGIYVMGAYGQAPGQRKAGASVMRVGLILFVVFGAFFEMIFSMDRSLGFRGFLFPVLLILLGAYLIVRRLWWSGAGASSNTEPQIPPTPPTSNL